MISVLNVVVSKSSFEQAFPVVGSTRKVFRCLVLLVASFCPYTSVAQGPIIQIIDATGDGNGNTLDFSANISTDTAGNVYVTGRDSNNAFKIAPNGLITEIIGASGDGSGNTLDRPRGLAVDTMHNIYVAGNDSNNVFKITSSGSITEIIDASGDGSGNTVEEVANIAVDAGGNVYVVAEETRNAFKVEPNGLIMQIIDATGDGSGNVYDASNTTAGVAVDAAGNVYVTGGDSDNVFKIAPSGSITEIINAIGDGSGNTLDEPNGITVDAAGNVYVTGLRSNNAFKITPSGSITEIINATGDGSGNTLDTPFGIAVDTPGNVYVTGFLSNNAFSITPTGAITEIIDASGDGSGNTLDGAVDITVGGEGNVYVTGAFSDNAFRIDPISRLIPPTVIRLPVVGQQLRSAFGEVLGVPSNATAVSLNVTAVDPTAAGFITVWPCSVERPLASNVNYVAGDIVPNGVIATVGTGGSVCFFSQQNTDVVVDIAGWFEGTAYTGATPTRLNDTRDGTGGILGPIESSSPLTIQVAGLQVLDANGVSTTVPSTISAVALNVTVVEPASAGFVTVWPCDVARPLSSNVNYTQNLIVANGVIAPVSATGTVCLYTLVPTDIVVDLAGWFPEQSFTGTTPTRLVDTRDGTGGRTGTITSTDELSVPIHNITLDVDGLPQEVPVTATAAALNVTIVNPIKAGFVTVWPCSVSRPLASNLNFVADQIVANNVVAPIGNDGSVCLYSNVPTDVIVDIAGWFSTSGTGAFVGTTPERLVDTRDGTGPAPE